MNIRSARGFTLIELVVALAIFALLAAMAYGGLSGVVRARAHLAQESRTLSSLQLAIGLIERDLRQAVVRPVRDRYGEARPTLIGLSTSIELSALAATSPLVATKPAVARVGYTALDGKLLRLAWPVLDRTPSTEPARHALLEGVDRIGLRYLDRGNQWQESWPPARGEGAQLDSLPRAIEVRIALRGNGEILRLIELPDAAVPPSPVGGAPPGAVR